MIAPNTNGTAAPVEPSDTGTTGKASRRKKKDRPAAGSRAGTAQTIALPALANDSDKSNERGRDLEPLVRRVLRTLLSEIDTDRPLINGKLAVDEKEAAALLGLHHWQLRDLRTSGKISFHRIVGGRVRYTYDNLWEYLDSNHQRATG
jgi:excisionase family DNA binding protein